MCIFKRNGLNYTYLTQDMVGHSQRIISEKNFRKEYNAMKEVVTSFEFFDLNFNRKSTLKWFMEGNPRIIFQFFPGLGVELIFAWILMVLWALMSVSRISQNFNDRRYSSLWGGNKSSGRAWLNIVKWWAKRMSQKDPWPAAATWGKRKFKNLKFWLEKWKYKYLLRNNRFGGFSKTVSIRKNVLGVREAKHTDLKNVLENSWIFLKNSI